MKIALIGFGKMGRIIADLAQRQNHDIILTIDAENLSDLKSELFKKADVAIEFTQPNQAYNNILSCFEANVPVVCGTTGWYDTLPQLKELCEKKNGTLIYASNFSIGVNLFFMLNKFLATSMNHYPNYKLNINETHHTAKLDAPSGTAITLAEDILKVHTAYNSWCKGDQTEQGIIPLHSFRENPAPGKHDIIYTSDIDEIKITHEAFNRNGFALGALHAAEWIKDKKGIYNFADVLASQFR